MKKKGGKKENEEKKEEVAEDWCFMCKDGGLLLVCDFKHCLKAYHPDCVGKDDSFLEDGCRWTCELHSCLICHGPSKFHCYCCPNAVCTRCTTAAEFASVKGKKGFCNNCLRLALLVEENRDVDSDGDSVDFKDRETYEGLFREYYEIIKEKEGLTMEDLISADVRMKKGNNHKSGPVPEDSSEDAENYHQSESENEEDIDEPKSWSKGKRSKGRWSTGKKIKSNRNEFIGWGSKSLIQFLESIGKDTSEKLSQHEVASIINKYINESKLLHPDNKRKIICDERLQPVLGRKIVTRNRIHDILDGHYAENFQHSEDEELGWYSEDNDEKVLETNKRQKKIGAESRSQKKGNASDVPQKMFASKMFASIVAENIKLVYLKRSLLQELSNQPETFESKVMGSFVRVISNPVDRSQRKTYHLAQVTGIKRTSDGEINSEFLLQVSNAAEDIHIRMLSDDEFSEEECTDLRQKVNDGLLKRPTLVKFEQKARTLHEDITKHWITKQLDLLQKLIDRANEKGWRNELFQYLERRQLLQTPAEQSRLLQTIPNVIACHLQLDPTSEGCVNTLEDVNSPKSILMGSMETRSDKWERNQAPSGDGAAINVCSSGKVRSGSADNGEGNGQAIKSFIAETNLQVKEVNPTEIPAPGSESAGSAQAMKSN